MSKCPRCNEGDLVQRETASSILLECSRRGKKVEDRECDYVESFSRKESGNLDRKEKEWCDIVLQGKGAG